MWDHVRVCTYAVATVQCCWSRSKITALLLPGIAFYSFLPLLLDYCFHIYDISYISLMHGIEIELSTCCLLHCTCCFWLIDWLWAIPFFGARGCEIGVMFVFIRAVQRSFVKKAGNMQTRVWRQKTADFSAVVRFILDHKQWLDTVTMARMFLQNFMATLYCRTVRKVEMEGNFKESSSWQCHWLCQWRIEQSSWGTRAISIWFTRNGGIGGWEQVCRIKNAQISQG